MTQNLFGETDPPEELDEPILQYSGPFAGVAIEQSIDRVLDYAIPKALISLLQVGHRVRVPLGRGNQVVHGYVVSISPTSDYKKIKELTAIDDDRVLVRPAMMELARWIGRYYCAPLGMVLDGIIPTAVKKRIGLGYSQQIRSAVSVEKLQLTIEQVKSPKRRAILARLLQVEEGKSIELNHLALEANVSPGTVKGLQKLGLISITEEPDLGTLDKSDDPTAGLQVPPALNEDQQKVMDDVGPRLLSGFSVNLLYGITGSGKTEIYLRCIEQVIAAGKQAIVLVPEIALTPQTVRRFTARFPRVAVQHSALTNTERHQFWQMISTGHAQVVVGARSAIFSPTNNLGIIIVDEEHEPSYKQDNIPRYHARDTAIKRAQIENVPVILGSATPSLEMWSRVHESAKVEQSVVAYHLLTMPRRVRGLSLPHVELIDLREVNKLRKGINLLSPRLEFLLETTIKAGQQAILLLNRRGYANCIYCPSCQEAIKCKYCDATMTFHRSATSHTHNSSASGSVHTGQMHCHYCLAVNTLPKECPICKKRLTLFGLGTQRVEEEIDRKFPGMKYARVDSDTMRSKSDYEALLNRFGRGEIEVMIGTQMIAKGLDYPNVTLVGVISGDTALALPDFRSAERTFQLITQVAGRAGRGDQPGRVVLQTFLPDDVSLQAAIRQDFPGFATTELENRRAVHLPPYGRMVRIILRDQSLEDLLKRGDDLSNKLLDAIHIARLPVDLKGPMPCPIERIAGYHRAQIVLHARSPVVLQQVLACVREQKGFATSDRVAVDVDPVSML